jgi:putative sterol carrier protein
LTPIHQNIEAIKGIDIEDEDIREFISLVIEIGNKKIDWSKVREKYGIPPDRTLMLRIVDVKGEVGFVIVGDKLYPIRGWEKPTVIVEMTKDVFWALATRKLSLYDAFLMGLVRFKGERHLRDAMILIPLFDQIYTYIMGG